MLVLLTTHRVESIAQALQVISWYRLRWHIEQLFRTVKRQGLGIEQSVVEDGVALEKLAMIALIGACITMQLVLARNADGQDNQLNASSMKEQIEVLHALQAKLQGRTSKQKNHIDPTVWRGPHDHRTPWRLTGYESERSTGPITMRMGSNASMLLSMATIWRKMCAQVSPQGRESPPRPWHARSITRCFLDTAIMKML